MKERFDKFMSELVETNAPLSFFSDFKKIAANVDAIAVKLNQLNYLVGQEDMERAIRNLWRWVLSIPFFISCIRQQNPLTVLSKIILRKVKQFNLPPQKK